MAVLLPNGRQQFFTTPGVPAVGYKLMTWAAGTSTPQTTWADALKIAANPNPIILDGRGEAVIFWDGVYKVQLLDATGAPVSAPVDNVSTLPSFSASVIPTVDNSLTLGSPAFSWANLYLGPNHTPVVDATGGIGYIARTAAEVAGTITPMNFASQTGNAQRYAADVTGVADSTAALTQWILATWAMFNYLDGQGLWNGGGAAMPIATLPPGKYKVSGSMVLPSSSTITGQAHPANTTSHTRLIMNSTGITPARVWSANAVIKPFSNIQAVSGGTTYRYSTTAGGISAATIPPWASAGTTTDGTVAWVNQGAVTAGDNRNTPIFKFSRATASGGAVLQDQNLNMTLANLEFWSVTPGSTFSAPISGASAQFGDYPLGGVLYYDCDTVDSRIVSCVFQNTACGIRINNAKSGTTGSDGFANAFGVNLWIEECEFDTAAAHISATNSNLDLVFRNCAFYGGIHSYVGCTGRVVYDNCRFYGGAYIDASASTNNFTLFRIGGGEFEQQNIYDNISIYGANTLDIKSLTVTGAGGTCGIVAQQCNSGGISGCSINDSGFNSSAVTGIAAVAAIKMIDCFNMAVTANNITATDAASYNGFGILTLSSGRGSQNNFISGNCVTATYTGAPFAGQNRRINLATADVLGLNYDPNGWPIVRLGTITTPRTAIAYAASIALNAAVANEFEVTVSSGVAFTMANPTNPSEGQQITITFLNTSGGAMGAITWGAAFKVAAFTAPANGASRSISLKYNGTNWTQLFVSTIDVPN